MAKNKNRDRKQPQSQRSSQVAQSSGMEPEDEQRATQVTPSEAARKGKKRFGHN
jgi:hypothetical protein